MHHNKPFEKRIGVYDISYINVKLFVYEKKSRSSEKCLSRNFVKMEVNDSVSTNNMVKLIYGNESVIANKVLLSEFSMYFHAMFSGNYIENDIEEISIEAIDPETMGSIIQYINQGLIDLEGYDNDKLELLAKGAFFLQMEELIKQIKQTLLNRLTESNWLEIKDLAEKIQSGDLERTTITFGLLSFHLMKLEYFNNFKNLHWYLSHPYLDIDSEYDAFKFGFDWVLKHEFSADAFLVLISCLDITALTQTQLRDILLLLKDYEHSLAAKVIECLHFLVETNELDVDKMIAEKQLICEKYTECVYNEVLELLKCNCTRKLDLVPCLSFYPERRIIHSRDSIDEDPADIKKRKTEREESIKEQTHYVYQYKNNDLNKWLDVGVKRLWGWSLTTWDKTKLVIVGGEYMRGSGRFNKEVAIYDVFSEKWERHSATLPDMRHTGLAVLRNKLFIAGGCSTYRVILTKCLVYDLVQRSYERVTDIPDPMQNPAMCCHEGSIYLSSVRDVYKYEEGDWGGRWSLVLDLNIRANQLLSFGGHIYFSQYYHNDLHRFKPGGDKNQFETVARFENTVCSICRAAGGKIIAFTQSMLSSESLSVELYKDGNTQVLWKEEKNHLIVYDAGGCCALFTAVMPLETPVSAYSKKYQALLES